MMAYKGWVADDRAEGRGTEFGWVKAKEVCDAEVSVGGWKDVCNIFLTSRVNVDSVHKRIRVHTMPLPKDSGCSSDEHTFTVARIEDGAGTLRQCPLHQDSSKPIRSVIGSQQSLRGHSAITVERYTL